MGISRWYRSPISADATVGGILVAIKRHPLVEYAEPNYIGPVLPKVATADGQYVTEEIMVKLKQGISISDLMNAMRITIQTLPDSYADNIKALGFSNWYRLPIASEIPVKKAVDFARGLSVVEYAEPNYINPISSNITAASLKYVPNEILIKLRPGVSVEDFVASIPDIPASYAEQIKPYGSPQWYRAPVGSGLTLEDAINYVRKLPTVEYAELNYLS